MSYWFCFVAVVIISRYISNILTEHMQDLCNSIVTELSVMNSAEELSRIEELPSSYQLNTQSIV